MIRSESAIFLVVGSLTVLIDFLIYRGLVWTNLVSVDWAKALGFAAGTLFAYFANRSWTFGHKLHLPGSAWRFMVLYTLTLGANVCANSLLMSLFDTTPLTVYSAFLVATGVSACLNFLGMKVFVFPAKPVQE